LSDSEITALERRIREGDTSAWDAIDAALARVGRPPRRVWNVYSSCGEYADKTEMTWSPFFIVRADAVAFMERLALDRDWEDWKRSDDDPGVFYPDGGSRSQGVMRVEWSEVVPPGDTALGQCRFRHKSDKPECDRPAGHP